MKTVNIPCKKNRTTDRMKNPDWSFQHKIEKQTKNTKKEKEKKRVLAKQIATRNGGNQENN